MLSRPPGTLNPESRATSVSVLSEWEGAPKTPTHQSSIHIRRLWHNFSLTSGPGRLGYLPQNRHEDYNVQPVSAFLLLHEGCVLQIQVTRGAFVARVAKVTCLHDTGEGEGF